jgi:PIN domain nuclease of toxin-antitoxin system
MLKIQYTDPELVYLTLGNFIPYLKMNNWNQIVSDPFFVFQGHEDDDGDPIKIVLPKGDDHDDVLRRYADAINLLSVLENRSPYEIIKTINSIDKDIIFIKFDTSSISLAQAAGFVEKIRRFWSLAASSEESPQQFLSKSLGIGMLYTDKCCFGHTIKGSFGFTIESPVSPRPHPQSTLDGGKVEQIPPFERRVVERIIRGIKNTQEAVIEGNVDILVNNYKTGLNANTCDVLSEILENFNEIQSEYFVSWSPIWEIKPDIANIRVQLDSKAPEYLKSASKTLKQEDTVQIVTINGKIVELNRDLDAHEEESSDESIIIVLDESGRRVHVLLSEDEYRDACNAHRDKKTISIVGTLEKIGHFWHLLAPHDFQICS